MALSSTLKHPDAHTLKHPDIHIVRINTACSWDPSAVDNVQKGSRHKRTSALWASDIFVEVRKGRPLPETIPGRQDKGQGISASLKHFFQTQNRSHGGGAITCEGVWQVSSFIDTAPLIPLDFGHGSAPNT